MNKKAILVVSFGTTFDDTREKTIGAIEKELELAFPGWEIRRAFTSPTILRKLAEKGIPTDNMWQALERLAGDGFTRVLCQPTYVVNGEEYEDMVALAAQYEPRFESICCGKPLLSNTRDFKMAEEAIKSVFSGLDEKTVLVLMGHGTAHHANAAYAAMDYVFKNSGARNIFVGAVEAYPGLEEVRAQVVALKPERVVLAPFMVVAGDHAVNDMAGEEDSWKTAFEKCGYSVQAVLKGLGEYPAVRAIYVQHARQMMNMHQMANMF